MKTEDNLEVFFIGDVAMDEYYSIKSFPKKGSKEIVYPLGKKMGGMIANASCIFNQLSNDNIHFFTALNSSESSKIMCQELDFQGIDTSMMIWDDSLPDAKTIIFLTEEDNTVFIPTLSLQKMEISDLLYDKLISSDCIYSTFCEISPMCYKEKNVYDILNDTKNNGVLFFCDLDVADIDDNQLKLLQYVDVLFINENGYNNLNKILGKNIDSKIFEYGIKFMVITKGANGCTVVTPNETQNINGIKVPVVDVTGAGDTFCSSFMFQYMKSKNIFFSAKFANAAGALAVTQMGARAKNITETNVLNFMKENEEGKNETN